MRYLLDTNILSDLLRHPQGKAARKIRQYGEDQVCTSIISSAELRYGAVTKGSAVFAEQVETFLGLIAILPIESPADAIYAELRARLKKMGKQIGGNDLLIAAQAIMLDLILVTDNEREFRRITELSCENWLR